ncbi:Membrane attack complex component/perforin [Sesbania bispinosa]|nr:Membrane attack complex component/perforin [Sesbania bispinosa]
MSEYFNVAMRLTGKIPSGHFCASFGLSGNTAPTTDMSLAYDGWFFKRYAFELERYDGASDHIKEAVPSGWDTQALARFIKRFGTHIVVAVSMGGKDVLYVRQDHDPSLSHEPTRLLNFLKDKASKRFMDSAENHCLTSQVLCNNKENIVMICNRRGGSCEMMRHSEWLDTIDSKPDLISLFLLPLSTLLSGTRGVGFLSHAINLYVRYKPPLEDLHQFLEFQLPRRWAPVFSEISYPRRRNQIKSGLRLGILGPTLHINTNQVDVGNRPVTGLRLYLEGRRSNNLAIHLQHLDSLPKSFLFSKHVVTRMVANSIRKNCLRLQLRFSEVIGASPQNKMNPTKLGSRSEIVRGTEHSPGYWVVSGAGLYIHNGEINLRVKYSLLNFIHNGEINLREAIDSIGFGFDITQDICFENIKRGPRLIQINEEQRRDLKIPGGISIPNVPNSIICLGGESYRIQSEILSFDKMSEHFNVAMRLTGKIPSGHFCGSFGLSGNSNTAPSPTSAMSLAYDGWFFRRYASELKWYGRASDHLKEAIPSHWDPHHLAR